ncbi:MAG: T9SS type A sorting domain-containing protein [Crocinitomicaceae bacterium]|nr:T9SS type A sorting domain-containing protein [Flavobacteriales bacterium]NQZ35554.1 T9SS type A sorting domain-containing protein [Crocinitomicaceae bacterium]
MKNKNIYIETSSISILSALLFIVTGINSFAQTGTLDDTFGTNGKVITTFGIFNAKGNSMAIQSDDKIVLGGYSSTSFTTSDFTLIRYNNDGTMDNSFGTGGKVTTPIGYQSQGHSVAIQSDGKILLGGHEDWYINLARYNSDGSLDTTFGSGGIVITDVPGHYGDVCKSVAIQTDGKILLGGYAASDGPDQRHFVLIRYNSDGSLDTAFGSGGIVVGSIGECHSVKVQSNGKIVLGGFYDFSFAMERYNSDGTLDTTFGTNGKVITSIGSSSKGHSMAIQDDDKIVLGGYGYTNGIGFVFALARYNTDGTLDNTFGIGGTITTPVGTSNKGNSVLIQSDGKIILAGRSKTGAPIWDFTIVRYNTDGTLDTAFGTGGKTVTPIGISYSTAKSIGIDSNDKIILGGYVYIDSTLHFALTRYNGDVSVGLGEDFLIQGDSKVYPNPFNASTTIELSTPVDNAELTVFNTYGQLVKQVENISGQEIQLSRSNLPSGIYFFKLTENNKIIAADKLIISNK